jgi:hypothetical protein
MDGNNGGEGFNITAGGLDESSVGGSLVCFESFVVGCMYGFADVGETEGFRV